MLKGLGNLANLGSMLKQAQQMGSKIQDFNQRLKSQRATGTAGGGLVTVEVDGTGEVLSCRIDPSLLGSAGKDNSTATADRELLEDLLPPAINQAMTKVRSLQADAVQSMTEAFDLSALKDMFKLGGSEPGGAAPGSGQPGSSEPESGAPRGS